MNIGYIRLSTQEQNVICQEVLMEQLHVQDVYVDRISGKNLERPELTKVMESVWRWDAVMVERWWSKIFV